MRTATIVVLALVAALVAAESGNYLSMWANFKRDYNRKFQTEEEEKMRFGHFARNMKTAERMQALNPLAKFGVNQYSDLSETEFKSRHNAEKVYSALQARRANSELVVPTPEERAAAPSKQDWRAKGAVTNVKNQGQCGSCWSFSTTGSIEGQWFLAGNSLTSVSEQELVSCDTTDSGCNGGLMDSAFTWLVENRGGKIVTEASYPYVSGDGVVPSCQASRGTFGAQITGHKDINPTEDDMAAWMGVHGPLSIGVDATSWQTYNSGIMTNCVSSQVDHGVLIVGYDDTNSPPYWIIKNSWGPSWGEEGYIRVQKGTDQCLITNSPCTSVVGSGPAPTNPGPNPTNPPAPTNPPQPTGDFVQYTCEDFLCLSGCQKREFPTDQCLRLQGGGSAIAHCGEKLEMTEYPLSDDCSGSSEKTSMPLDQCLQDTDGSYIFNVCSASKEFNKHVHPFASRQSSSMAVRRLRK